MKTVKTLSKSLLLLFLLTTLFFVGCQKDKISEPAEVSNEQEYGDLYVMSTDNIDVPFEKLDLDLSELKSSPNQQASPRSGNTHAHGHYTQQPCGGCFYDPVVVSFNATENRNGVSGNAHITRTWEDGNGNEFSFQVILNADCLETDGGDALFKGLLTQVTGTPPPELVPLLNVGSRWFIRTRDNGQGPNAPDDEYHPIILFSSSPFFTCDLIGLDFILYSIIPFEPVAKRSDNIVVN